jgi:hypothetical protein
MLTGIAAMAIVLGSAHWTPCTATISLSIGARFAIRGAQVLRSFPLRPAPAG